MADFILMPQMGVSEESALLAEWKVKEGDVIKLEQPLFALETGKSSFEELAKYEGTLLKILVPAGEEVKVGAPVAVVGKPGESFAVPGAAAPAQEATPAAAPAAAPAPAAAATPAASDNADVNFILMPQMGVSEESALLSEWKVKEGDVIKLEQPLFALETGKSSFEELAKYEGTLLKILVPAGNEVAVGAPVAVVGKPGASFTIPGAAAPTPAQEATPAAAPAPAPAPAATPAVSGGKVLASPRARKLASELGLDLAQAQASGPEGRIIERDVKALKAAAPAATAAPASAPATPAPATTPAATPAAYTEEKISRLRKVIADNMHKSLAEMAQLTLNRTFDATAILELRKQMKNAPELGLNKVSLNDIVLFAVAKTLVEFPDINANFIGDKMRRFTHAQLGVAVDTPKGLLVPVLKDADTMSLMAISVAVKEFAAQCKDGTLPGDKLQGGSFTVTNLGNLGIESFTPIINPPQTAILGVCGTMLRPRQKADGSVEFYQAMGLSLTFDHRVVDGAPAAKFLKAVAEKLEKFNLILAL
ncbi:MAG: 2-oxo acid dehydrogenase subunit E2 [Lentisphaeria bacterium]|nr:2-oxo acid dehydrogenase subunit E2 [Lentisphaeria bacterium]